MINENEVIVLCGVDAVTSVLFGDKIKELAFKITGATDWKSVLTSAHFFRGNTIYSDDTYLYQEMIDSGYRVITTCKAQDEMKQVLGSIENVRLYNLSTRVL